LTVECELQSKCNSACLYSSYVRKILPPHPWIWFKQYLFERCLLYLTQPSFINREGGEGNSVWPWEDRCREVCWWQEDEARTVDNLTSCYVYQNYVLPLSPYRFRAVGFVCTNT
jgi:hypothetical protein